jgi:hypothetical protein
LSFAASVASVVRCRVFGTAWNESGPATRALASQSWILINRVCAVDAEDVSEFQHKLREQVGPFSRVWCHLRWFGETGFQLDIVCVACCVPCAMLMACVVLLVCVACVVCVCLLRVMCASLMPRVAGCLPLWRFVLSGADASCVLFRLSQSRQFSARLASMQDALAVAEEVSLRCCTFARASCCLHPSCCRRLSDFPSPRCIASSNLQRGCSHVALSCTLCRSVLMPSPISPSTF